MKCDVERRRLTRSFSWGSFLGDGPKTPRQSCRHHQYASQNGPRGLKFKVDYTRINYFQRLNKFACWRSKQTGRAQQIRDRVDARYGKRSAIIRPTELSESKYRPCVVSQHSCRRATMGISWEMPIVDVYHANASICCNSAWIGPVFLNSERVLINNKISVSPSSLSLSSSSCCALPRSAW